MRNYLLSTITLAIATLLTFKIPLDWMVGIGAYIFINVLLLVRYELKQLNQ